MLIIRRLVSLASGSIRFRHFQSLCTWLLMIHWVGGFDARCDENADSLMR